MPALLSTIVKHIYDRVQNPVNSKLIEDFRSHVEDNTTPERHQNNNLKAIIAYAEFLGSNSTFYQISTLEQITEFLDTKIRSNSEDPDQSILTGRISTLSILKPVLIKWIT
jgi:integrase/recombinase XerD